MSYFAHSYRDIEQCRWHLLKSHLQDTANIAATLASKFGGEKLAYIAGLAHDIGKYSLDFQRRLEGKNVKVDHSTAGAIEVKKSYGPLGLLLAYVISGHHCGLPDWGSEADESSLMARFTKKLKDYSAFSKEIAMPPPAEVSFPTIEPVISQGFSVQFLIRFIYSCLVDADFLDTERALDKRKAVLRKGDYSLQDLRNVLDSYLDSLCKKAASTVINIKRAEILNNCRNKALYQPGLFTLTVPTGGGKTLSSLSFALRHAVCHKKDRVIYVIPYTSIIEQNAAVFKEVLGEENVLEHHSNFAYPEEEKSEVESEFVGEIAQKLKLATENWDMPVVVTTNVQFFESLFASRNSRCRKLHNIANSVVIVDEAQLIPTGFLKPCINALVELTVNYNTTVVLCTATQPALEKLLPEGIKPIEIIDDPKGLLVAFKRVQTDYLGTISDDELISRLNKHRQTLCIVNSKKHARLLFNRLQGEGIYHLSTRMCPAHRTEVLQEIRKRLKDKLPCRVVSTQLIEAGVDVDFPVVFRSMAGLDSIAQAAGRCNREGLLKIGKLYVFWPEEHGMPKGWLSRTAALGGMILERLGDPLKLDSVNNYFSMLYEIDASELDKEGILAEISEQAQQLRFPFRTIAEKFKLIDNRTSTIIIPWNDECREILRKAQYNPHPGKYLRSLQRYAVEVFEQEFNELLQYGALDSIAGRFYVLKEEVFKEYYSNKTGLLPITESMFLNDTFVI